MTTEAMTIEAAMRHGRDGQHAHQPSTHATILNCGAWVPIVPRVPVVLVPGCVGAFGACGAVAMLSTLTVDRRPWTVDRTPWTVDRESRQLVL